MSNQEIQKVAEFHVFERNLYQMPARVPMKNGILDQRLVGEDSLASAGFSASLYRKPPPGVALTRVLRASARRAPLTRRVSVSRARGSSPIALATTVRCLHTTVNSLCVVQA